MLSSFYITEIVSFGLIILFHSFDEKNQNQEKEKDNLKGFDLPRNVWRRRRERRRAQDRRRYFSIPLAIAPRKLGFLILIRIDVTAID